MTTTPKIESLVRRQIIFALEDDLNGGELLMKEVWEECETPDHKIAAKQELVAIIGWLRERDRMKEP